MAQMPWQHLWILWLAVAAGMMLRKITLYQSFVKYLRAGRTDVDDLRTLDRFAALSERMGIRRAIDLYTNRLTASPLILGFRKAAVVLPEIPADNGEFRLICLHELTHYKRRDIWYKWLLQIVLCLHWFNPLAHLMVREVNRLCELSCDEAVLRALSAGERRNYGEALLRSLQTPGTYREGLAALTLNESAKSLKERLESIMKFTKPNRATSVLAVILAALLFTGGYALGAYRVKSPTENPIGETEFSPREINLYTGIAHQLMEKAHTVFSWYFNDLPFEELWMEFSEPDFEQGGVYYYKVKRFKTLAELKAATCEIFTEGFYKGNIQATLDAFKFIEKDGELYLGDNGGISESYSTPPKEYILRSVTADKVVLTAVCEGLDRYSEDPQAQMIDYSFELVLLKEGAEDPNLLDNDRWRVHSYYGFRPDGSVEGLEPYRPSLQPNSEPLGYTEQDGGADMYTDTPEPGVVISPTEYEAINEKHLVGLNIGMMISTSWNNANEIEPEHFLYYGAHVMIQNGVDIFGEDEGGFIKAETLESLVQSRFDVSTAHMRTNMYYSAERNAYEFGGLGSTTTTKVTNAVQTGSRLTVYYDAIGPMDYTLINGILEIEFADGDYLENNCRYLSNQMQWSAQYELAFPSAMRDADYAGVFMMESGGHTGVSNDGINFIYYDGGDLYSIAAFYKEQALPKLGASGTEEWLEDGWRWTGTYRGGQPLTIDVRHKFGDDSYIITALYEKDSQEYIAKNRLEREFMLPPDMSNYPELNYKYLWRLLKAGVLDASWSSPNDADAASLVRFYASRLNPDNENPPEAFPAADVELYSRRRFEVGAAKLRSANSYDAAGNTYINAPQSRSEICHITRATSLGEENGAIRILLAYNAMPSAGGETILWSGEVEIELSDKGYRYISHKLSTSFKTSP